MKEWEIHISEDPASPSVSMWIVSRRGPGYKPFLAAPLELTFNPLPEAGQKSEPTLVLPFFGGGPGMLQELHRALEQFGVAPAQDQELVAKATMEAKEDHIKDLRRLLSLDAPAGEQSVQVKIQKKEKP